MPTHEIDHRRPEHFLIQHVRQTCREHRLLRPGRLVVAASGGADSLALLYSLLALCAEFELDLHIASFDHGIRGAAGAADVAFMREIAAQHALPFSAGAEDVPVLAETWNIGFEAAARRARYAFLARVAERCGAFAIATGHHRDDQAETVLMHVLRGAGLAGLRGMLPQTPLAALNIPDLSPTALQLIRPLLDVPRAQIDSFVRDLGLVPRVDATNADTDYTRNQVRHRILPLLETVNSEVRAALARLAETAREDYDALRQSLPPLNVSESGVIIRRDEFQALHKAHQRLWLRLAVAHLAPGAELNFDQVRDTLSQVTQVAQVAQATTGQSFRADLGHGLRVRADLEHIAVYLSDAFPTTCPWLPPGSSVEIRVPGEYALPGGAWLLCVSETAPLSSEVLTGALAVRLNIPQDARIEVRTRRRADRFAPAGLGGHRQKLSDTFINLKIRQEWRDRLPLLCLNDQAIWFIYPSEGGLRARCGYLAPDESQYLCYFHYKPR